MTPRKSWFVLVAVLITAGLFLVACERPLPGGYNDPGAGSEETVPDIPVSVPEVGSEAYPADAQPSEAMEALPGEGEAYPAEEPAPVEEAPAEEAAPVEEEAPTEDAPVEEEASGEETPASSDAAASEDVAASDEAPTPEDATVEGSAGEAVETETPGTHTVAAGENLYRIGLLYGINWLDLAEANGIVDPASLSVGQVLTIPSPDSLSAEAETADVETAEVVEEAEPVEETETTEEAPAEESAAAETGESEAEEPAAEEAAAEERPESYIVQAGDTLFSIGVEFGLAWTELAAANGIVDEFIDVGQELIIPPLEDEAEVEDTSAETGEAEVEETTYVVQEGDTVYSVAFDHSIFWTDLVEANNIVEPFALEVGQTLIIPQAE